MATNELLKQGTLLDIMNNRAPNGNLLVVAEVLQKEIPMIKDAPWQEAVAQKYLWAIRCYQSPHQECRC
jgi:hypothetical protein